MDRQQIETVVLRTLAAVLKREVNVDSSHNNTAEWDSLKHIEIVFALEDELGLQFFEEELPCLNSVASIVEKAYLHYAS